MSGVDTIREYRFPRTEDNNNTIGLSDQSSSLNDANFPPQADQPARKRSSQDLYPSFDKEAPAQQKLHQFKPIAPVPPSMLPLSSPAKPSTASRFHVEALSLGSSNVPLPQREEAGTEVPTKKEEPVKQEISRIPLEDVMALREFLRQVDLRHYGFRCEYENDHSTFVSSSPSRSKSASLFLNSPRGGSGNNHLATDSQGGESYSSNDDDYDDFVMNSPRKQGSGVSVVPSSPLKPVRQPDRKSVV